MAGDLREGSQQEAFGTDYIVAAEASLTVWHNHDSRQAEE